MKIKFLSNNLDWNVKSELTKVEKEFRKCEVDLDIDLAKINIPIVWDTTWGAPVYTRQDWFHSTIYPLGKGYKITALGIGKKDWKAKNTGGWHKLPLNGQFGIEVEVTTKSHKVKSGKSWLVHVLAHELCHEIYAIRNWGHPKPIEDQTHNYLYNSNPKFQLKECLSHLDPKFIKSL